MTLTLRKSLSAQLFFLFPHVEDRWWKPATRPPQCLCPLICMWLISVWKSCLWSAGRNPDSSVLHNLRDVLEIEFPSPATHEKSVCHPVAPSSFPTCPPPWWLAQGAVSVRLHASMHPPVCLFELQLLRGRMDGVVCFSVCFHIFLCFVFSRRWAQMLLLIGLFTDNIIRITKMAQFWALHQTALIIQNHFSLFLNLFFFTFLFPLWGWVERALCLFAASAVINASASLTFTGAQKKLHWPDVDLFGFFLFFYLPPSLLMDAFRAKQEFSLRQCVCV